MRTEEIRRAVATRMAQAAEAWLDGLDVGQREQAAWPFPADEERRRWYYTPTDHGGLTLGAMSAASAAGGDAPAARRVVRRRLHHRDHHHGTRERPRRGRGVADDRSAVSAGVTRACTTSACSAHPGPATTWSWRFGGHHVSVNHTIVDGELDVVDAVLPRCRPGTLGAARAAPAATARRRRGSRARAGPIARRRPARSRAAVTGSTGWTSSPPTVRAPRRATAPCRSGRSSAVRSRAHCRSSWRASRRRWRRRSDCARSTSMPSA